MGLIDIVNFFWRPDLATPRSIEVDRGGKMSSISFALESDTIKYNQYEVTAIKRMTAHCISIMLPDIPDGARLS